MILSTGGLWRFFPVDFISRNLIRLDAFSLSAQVKGDAQTLMLLCEKYEHKGAFGVWDLRFYLQGKNVCSVSKHQRADAVAGTTVMKTAVKNRDLSVSHAPTHLSLLKHVMQRCMAIFWAPHVRRGIKMSRTEDSLWFVSFLSSGFCCGPHLTAGSDNHMLRMTYRGNTASRTSSLPVLPRRLEEHHEPFSSETQKSDLSELRGERFKPLGYRTSRGINDG